MNVLDATELYSLKWLHGEFHVLYILPQLEEEGEEEEGETEEKKAPRALGRGEGN